MDAGLTTYALNAAHRTLPHNVPLHGQQHKGNPIKVSSTIAAPQAGNPRKGELV